MLESILQGDAELLVFLNNLGCNLFDSMWIAISAKHTWIPLYAFLLYLLIKNYWRTPNFYWALISVGICFFFTDFMVSQVFRPLFHRLRPCHIPELVEQLRLLKPTCGGQYGFPSAHSSNSWGLATLMILILYPVYKKKMYGLLIWAAMVAYSRIYLGVHYPLDVMGGAIYGSTIAVLVYSVYKKLLNRRWVKEI